MLFVEPRAAARRAPQHDCRTFELQDFRDTVMIKPTSLPQDGPWEAGVTVLLLAGWRAEAYRTARRPRFRHLLACGSWAYLVGVIAVWLLIRLAGDRWWFATLLLFGPRWLILLPLAVLVPLALGFHRRSLLPLGLAAVLGVGPLMGFCLPWARLSGSGQPTVRVLTCNVKGQCQDNPRLNDLIQQAAPDIVALQGCWRQVRVAWPAGWHVCQQGELLVASRFPLREFTDTTPARTGDRDPPGKVLSCCIHLPEGELRFATVHMQSPHFGIARVLDRRVGIQPSRNDVLNAEMENRWQESQEVAQRLADEFRADVVVGDFNLPEESPIYRVCWGSYWNAFGTSGWGWGGTEWPTVPTHIPFGIRIDHILSDRGWRPQRCWVGSDVGADHLPLLADLSLATTEASDGDGG
jgi:vancomycin resistance protein VanJ